MSGEIQKQRVNEMWAIVELMGHGQTAGLIKKSDLGGLLRIDVPIEDGMRTEYYGEAAIYAIRIVSEEIARAYAVSDREIAVYDTPIVPRQQYEDALQKARQHSESLKNQVQVLQDRLTRVMRFLPELAEKEDQAAGSAHITDE